MKLTELINELKFNTGDTEILLKLDENIEKEHIEIELHQNIDVCN